MSKLRSGRLRHNDCPRSSQSVYDDSITFRYMTGQRTRSLRCQITSTWGEILNCYWHSMERASRILLQFVEKPCFLLSLFSADEGKRIV
jgi:hypothetical protein